jgi:hypothetical protein
MVLPASPWVIAVGKSPFGGNRRTFLGFSQKSIASALQRRLVVVYCSDGNNRHEQIAAAASSLALKLPDLRLM